LPPGLPGAAFPQPEAVLPDAPRADRLSARPPVRRAAVLAAGRLHRVHAQLLSQAARRGAPGVRLRAPERALSPRDPARDLRALRVRVPGDGVRSARFSDPDRRPAGARLPRASGRGLSRLTPAGATASAGLGDECRIALGEPMGFEPTTSTVQTS